MANQAALRKRHGPGLFGHKGKFYDATKKTLELSADGAYEAVGNGNAAFAEETRVTCNFGEPPGIKEGDPCTICGQAFTVKKVLLPEIGNVAQPLIVYRTPPDDDQTAPPAPDPVTGERSRKEYYPSAPSGT